MIKLYKNYLLLLVCFTVSCSNSQTNFSQYDTFVWNAMLSYKKGNYQKALKNFQSAFKIIPNENVSDYFYAAASAFKLNNDATAKDLIITSIVETNSSEDYFDTFKEFDTYREKAIFKEIKKNYHKHQTQFFKNLEHPEIYKEIDSLVKADQQIRKSTAEDRMQKMIKIDSLNIKRLIEITKTYGWQPRGWLILWHQRGTYEEGSYVWDFFKPYINSQIEKGTIRKDFWAFFEEEQSVIKNKKQIYGLYTANYEQFPILDIKNVDKRREKLGMPPLWYLKEVYDTKLPGDYPYLSKNSFE